MAETFKFQDGSTFDVNGTQLVGPNSLSSMPITTGLNEIVQANISPVIPVDQIKPVAPLINGLPMPEELPDMTNAMANGANEYSKSLESYIKDLTPTALTPLQQERSGIMDRIKSLLPQTEGKGQAILQAEASAGVPELQKQLASLNTQIKTKYAEFQKEQASLGVNEPMSRGSYIGRDAAIRRQGIAELSLLEARAQGLQGEITAQQNSIDRAVGLLFADQEQKLNNLQRQLEFIKPMLNEEQSVLAIARERKITEEREAIAEEKTKRKENLNLAFSTNTISKFANRNGEIFRVSDGKSYSTPEEFFRDAGVKSFEDAYARGLVRDLSQNIVDERNFVMQAAIKYPDAGILPGDSVETATTKLQNSQAYQKDVYQDTSYTLSPGEVKYDKDGNIIAVGPEKDKARDTSIAEIGGKKVLIDNQTGEVINDFSDLASETDTGASPELLGPNGEAVKLAGNQVDTLAGYKNTLASAQSALALLEQGVKTGPIAGRSLSGKKMLGIADPKQLELEQTLGKIKADFMKALSGAAVSDSEVKRLSKFLPSITDQESVIRSKLNTLMKETQQSEANFIRTLGATKNTIRVKEKSTGKTGTIPINEYDPNVYEKISFKSAGNAIASKNEYIKRVGNGKVIAGSPYHKGGELDIDGKIGDPVPAFEGGRVVEVKDSGKSGYGKHVIVENSRGERYIYGHLDRFNVKKGQVIPSGYTVGKMGNSGNVLAGKGGDGSHLHIEKRDKKGRVVALK